MSKANQFDLSKLSPEEKKALDEFMEELFTMAILAQDKKARLTDSIERQRRGCVC